MDLNRIMNDLEKKHLGEGEYLQAVREVFESIEESVDENPHFESAGIIERLIEPDRVLTFKVSWVDDNGKVHINLGTEYNLTMQLAHTKVGYDFTQALTSASSSF